MDFMQEGQSNINKFGHSAPIRGPTTIHASANPVHGDFTRLDNGKIDINEVTIISPLRDRFDLTFVFQTENNHAKLLEYADKKGRPVKPRRGSNMFAIPCQVYHACKENQSKVK